MKRKLLYLASIALFSAFSVNAQQKWECTQVTADNSDFATTQTAYASGSTTTVNGLTLVAGATTTFGATATTTGSTFTDGYVSSAFLKTGGGGITGVTPALTQSDYLSPTANFMPNQRYMYFAVPAGNTTVTVWFKTSSNASPRSMICTNGVDFKKYATTTSTASGVGSDVSILVANYSGPATNLYLYSDLGANISKITVSATAALGTNTFSKESDVTVYTKDSKVFFSNIKSKTNVAIYSITGALIKSADVNEDSGVEAGNGGVYIVKLKNAEGEKTTKVIVQ